MINFHKQTWSILCRFPARRFWLVVNFVVRVGQVTDTADRNFMADLHPNSDNIWIVGGGSGHGFKHGPSVGEHTAKRIMGKDIDDAYLAAFKVMKEDII